MRNEPRPHWITIFVGIVSLVIGASGWYTAWHAQKDADESIASASEANRLAREANQLAKEASHHNLDSSWLTTIADAINECRTSKGVLASEGDLSELRDKAFTDIGEGAFNREAYRVEVATRLPLDCQARVAALNSPSATGGEPALEELRGWGLQVGADRTHAAALDERNKGLNDPAYRDRIVVLHQQAGEFPWRTVLVGFPTSAAALEAYPGASRIFEHATTLVPLNLAAFCPSGQRSSGYINCA